ncbi:GHKL domain-containing protein [Enterococcus sp. UD-01]|jgi:two-component system sensor histidine kinase AgrC|uniref:GHKL domain-containing protein n=1 Tax=Enterococcus sp. UD-01 TaxID=3373911 RepID=UPI00383459A0
MLLLFSMYVLLIPFFILELSPIFIFLKKTLTKREVLILILCKLGYELFLLAHYHLPLFESFPFAHSIYIFVLLIPLYYFTKNLILAALLVDLSLLIKDVCQAIYEYFDHIFYGFISTQIPSERISYYVYSISWRLLVGVSIILFSLALMKLLNYFEIIKKIREIPMDIINICVGSIVILLTICMVEIGVFFIFTDYRYLLWQQLVGSLAYFIVPLLVIWISVYSGKYFNERQTSKQAIIHAQELELASLELRKFKHDYTNMLVGMQEYIKQGNIEGMKEFHEAIKENLNQIEVQESSLYFQLTNMDSAGMRGVVSNKIARAKEDNISISLHIPEKVKIINSKDELRLVRYLGILLDNSIEAVGKYTDGRISLGIFQEEEKLEIVVINNHIKQENFIAMQHGHSTKGKGRGLGLKSIMDFFRKKKNGYLEIDIKDDTCKITMVYYMQEKKNLGENK